MHITLKTYITWVPNHISNKLPSTKNTLLQQKWSFNYKFTFICTKYFTKLHIIINTQLNKR